MDIELTEVENSSQLKIYCSFCGRSNFECRVMVAGESAAICNHCLVIACDTVGTADGEAEYQSWLRSLTPNWLAGRKPAP